MPVPVTATSAIASANDCPMAGSTIGPESVAPVDLGRRLGQRLEFVRPVAVGEDAKRVGVLCLEQRCGPTELVAIRALNSAS